MTAVAQLRGPIARTSLADTVYQHILEAILSGGLPAGTELSEVALAAELGVSRTPVHEALRRLAADELVVQLASRRVRVAKFERPDILEIYEMRKVLECAAVERAARQIDPEELTALSEETDRLMQASPSRGWTARVLEFDQRFHAVLATAAGNDRLRSEITKYRHLVRAFCRLSGNRANLRAAMAEHRRILDALAARDAGGARRAMAAHIDARLAAVLAELEQSSSS
jgi:DNA-binding GntR family transcriptional regulator